MLLSCLLWSNSEGQPGRLTIPSRNQQNIRAHYVNISVLSKAVLYLSHSFLNFIDLIHGFYIQITDFV